MKRCQGRGFSSGAPLFVFDEELRILSWNEAAEDLTGIPAEEAVGQPCWQVLGGRDDRGELVCHKGCTNARLVREGFEIPSRNLDVRTARGGRRRVALDTIASHSGDRPRFLHVLRGRLSRLSTPLRPPRRPGRSLT